MGFFRYLVRSRMDNQLSLALLSGFAVFYVAMNLPYIHFMNANEALLAAHNQFYGVPFSLNLFNFDPSMYYGAGNTSIIHPLINYITGPLTFLAHHTFGNLFFLLLQSVLNALGVAMMFYYVRNASQDQWLALLFALFYGVSSYTIFTALIPDSYPYVQFILILSVLYLQYVRLEGKPVPVPGAFLTLGNFGATSTNVVPFTAALFFNTIDWRDRRTWYRFAFTLLIGLVLIGVGTLLQFVFFGGQSWVTNWAKSLHAGGYSYTAPFRLSEHWKAVYMLVISPVLTPDVAMIDPDIVAFATDLTRPYPLHATIVGFVLITLAALGFITGIRSREVWTLAPFIGFAGYLHIYKGFGLAAFNYDLYLYAGHYLFAFFLLAAAFVARIRRSHWRKAMAGLLLVFILVTLGNNVVQHAQTLHTIEKAYAEISRLTEMTAAISPKTGDLDF